MSTLSDSGSPPRFAPDDFRVAAAALLIHIGGIDGVFSTAERETLRDILRRRFSLDDASIDALIDEASAVEREAIDLYGFTARLNRVLDAADRERLVASMWDVVFADGRATEFESNLIWRAADLLGVSRETRIALRQQAQARAGDIGGDNS
ncbi:MAG: TerB family tellurite resistance protein [Pseudolabrys sp.]